VFLSNILIYSPKVINIQRRGYIFDHICPSKNLNNLDDESVYLKEKQQWYMKNKQQIFKILPDVERQDSFLDSISTREV